MILEGLISTMDEAGQPHLAAMGPRVDDNFTRFELRPFGTSSTARNLSRTAAGVFHVTDDAALVARTVLGEQPPPDVWQPAIAVPGFVLGNACRAYELKVVFHDFSGARGIATCAVERVQRIRDFFGFNRAKHAVIEAAILASRIDFLPRSEIETKWEFLRPMVEKTGGEAERQAFQQLTDFIEKSYQVTSSGG
jgi:hypothetical protein